MSADCLVSNSISGTPVWEVNGRMLTRLISLPSSMPSIRNSTCPRSTSRQHLALFVLLDVPSVLIWTARNSKSVERCRLFFVLSVFFALSLQHVQSSAAYFSSDLFGSSPPFPAMRPNQILCVKWLVVDPTTLRQAERFFGFNFSPLEGNTRVRLPPMKS